MGPAGHSRGAKMGLLASIGVALRSIGRLLGIAGATAPQAACVADTPESAGTIAGPAVAGFVMRAYQDRFLLGRRLAAVARLNTPAGRRPRGRSKRPAHLPPLPAARLGAKRTRIDGNVGPRVLKRAHPPVRPSAEVIELPRAPRGGAQRPPGHLARAA